MASNRQIADGRPVNQAERHHRQRQGRDDTPKVGMQIAPVFLVVVPRGRPDFGNLAGSREFQARWKVRRKQAENRSDAQIPKIGFVRATSLFLCRIAASLM